MTEYKLFKKGEFLKEAAKTEDFFSRALDRRTELRNQKTIYPRRHGIPLCRGRKVYYNPWGRGGRARRGGINITFVRNSARLEGQRCQSHGVERELSADIYVRLSHGIV